MGAAWLLLRVAQEKKRLFGVSAADDAAGASLHNALHCRRVRSAFASLVVTGVMCVLQVRRRQRRRCHRAACCSPGNRRKHHLVSRARSRDRPSKRVTRAPQGSIKDLLYSCPKEWKTSYIQKYTAKRGSPLPEKTVASFARQILEGMMFLERKGWPYLVVSTGNVLLSRNQSHCQLCDVESAILGVSPRCAHLVRRSLSISCRRLLRHAHAGSRWLRRFDHRLRPHCVRFIFASESFDPARAGSFSFTRFASSYEMACGVELDSQQLPANIPCAQPIIKLLKLIWSVLSFRFTSQREHCRSLSRISLTLQPAGPNLTSRWKSSPATRSLPAFHSKMKSPP